MELFLGWPSSGYLWRDLREIFRKRPDFGPTTPELRENPEECDKSLHYPYEKQGS